MSRGFPPKLTGATRIADVRKPQQRLSRVKSGGAEGDEGGNRRLAAGGPRRASAGVAISAGALSRVSGNSWAAHWRPSSARQRSRGKPVNSCPPRVRPSGRLRAIWCAAGRLVRTSPASRRKAREVGREPEHVGAPVVSALAPKPRCGGDSPYKPCL